MPDFEIIVEFSRPVALIIRERLASRQFNVLYSLAPENSRCQFDLAKRWDSYVVIARDDWAQEQRRRTPMLKPQGLKLQFIAS